jgi:hypothetical protein
MIRIGSPVTQTNQDLTVSSVVLATVAAPATGTMRYLVRAVLSNLPSNYSLLITEGYAAGTYVNPPLIGGGGIRLVQIEVVLTAGDASVPITIIDQDGAANAVSWTVEVFTDDSSASNVPADLGARLDTIDKRLFATMMRSYGVSSKADLIAIANLLP